MHGCVVHYSQKLILDEGFEVFYSTEGKNCIVTVSTSSETTKIMQIRTFKINKTLYLWARIRFSSLMQSAFLVIDSLHLCILSNRFEISGICSRSENENINASKIKFFFFFCIKRTTIQSINV